MGESESLRDILDAVARGTFPPADGRTTIVPQAAHRDAGVLAFTAHAVVFTDEDPGGPPSGGGYGGPWPVSTATRCPRR